MPSYMKTKALLRCGFISAALLVSNYAFAAGEGPAIIDRWVEDSKSHSFIELSYQGASFDEASDVTTVLGFKAVFSFEFTFLAFDQHNVPKFTQVIEVPSLRYVALGETLDRYFAESIEADEIRVAYLLESGTTGVQSIESAGTFSGMVVTSADWSKLPDVVNDPSKPISQYYPLAEAFVDKSFASIKINSSEFSQTLNMPNFLKMTSGPLQFNNISGSDFSSFLFEEITMISAPLLKKYADDSDVEWMVDIASVEGGAYNFGTWVRQFDPALSANESDLSFNKLIGSLVFNGTQVDINGVANLSLGEVSSSDWGARPPNLPLLSLADELYMEFKATGSGADEKTILRMLSSIGSMFHIGSLDTVDLKFQENNTDNRPNLIGKLASFRLSDFGSAGMGELTAKGLLASGEAGNVQIHLDLFHLKDVGFPTLEALLNAERASEEMDIKGVVASLPTLSLLEVSGFNMGIEGGRQQGLEFMSLEMGNFIGRLPTTASAIIKNLQNNVADLNEEGRELFENMGYERMNLSFGLSFVWDEVSKILSLTSHHFVEDGGTLDARLEIGGVPRNVFENPEMAQNALAFLTVNTAFVHFTDNSILERLFSAKSFEHGITTDQLKQGFLARLPFMMSFLNRPDFVNEFSAAVSKLLSEGGSLTATAQPDQPVSVMQVIAGGAAAPGTLVDLLKVEVIAE